MTSRISRRARWAASPRYPLLVFDGLSGQLITALLRPGRAHAAKGSITILTRLIRVIRRRCPRASILVRGDSAFAMPALLDRLEQLDHELGDVEYVTGVASNSRLLEIAKPLRSSVEEQFLWGYSRVRSVAAAWSSSAAMSAWVTGPGFADHLVRATRSPSSATGLAVQA